MAVDNAAYGATQTPYISIPIPMPMPGGALYQEGSVLQDQSQAFLNDETRVQRRASEEAVATSKDVKDIANAYLRDIVGKWESRPTSPNDIRCPPVDVLKRAVEALREIQDCDIDNIIKDIRRGKMGISENDVGNGQSPVYSC